MKRSEFLDWSEEIGFEELLEFCSENALYTCDEIVTEYSMDDNINEFIFHQIRDGYMGWEDVLEYLRDLPRGYDYYRQDNNSNEYYPLDCDDLSNYIDDVIREMDDGSLWDDEEEDDENNEDEENLLSEEAEEESMSIIELLTISDRIF